MFFLINLNKLVLKIILYFNYIHIWKLQFLIKIKSFNILTNVIKLNVRGLLPTISNLSPVPPSVRIYDHNNLTYFVLWMSISAIMLKRKSFLYCGCRHLNRFFLIFILNFFAWLLIHLM